MFRTLLNTLLSAAFSGATTMAMKCILRFSETLLDGPYDAQLLCNGVLTGLVASSGGVMNMESWASVAVGIISGILYYLSIELFDKIKKLDDPCHAISVYLIGGIWGIFSMAFLDQT